jgi:putative ABC transport system ATP-binding protein
VADILVFDGVTKRYEGAETAVTALEDVSFSARAGETVAVMGPSGCGKSTLLHLAGAIDRPTSGRVLIDSRPTEAMRDAELTRLRRRRIGFVFQFFHLLPTLTVEENIELPLLLAGGSAADRGSRTRELVERLGLSARARHRPHQLSGGEQQRVAIGRALAPRPSIILADEPTGNLDSATGRSILDLLTGLPKSDGVTLILATHEHEAAARADRVLHLKDGRLQPAD